jgi:hypothetical protein
LALGSDAASTEGAGEDNGELHMDGGSGALGAGVLNVGDLNTLTGGGDGLTSTDVLRASSGVGLVTIGGGGLSAEVETLFQHDTCSIMLSAFP